MRKVCCKCKAVIVNGPYLNGEPVSHGYCDPCAAEEMAKTEEWLKTIDVARQGSETSTDSHR